MVTHQLQVERRTGKVHQSDTDVLPLCHATNVGYLCLYFLLGDAAIAGIRVLLRCYIPGCCSPQHETSERCQQRSTEFGRQQVHQCFFRRRAEATSRQQPANVPSQLRITLHMHSATWHSGRTSVSDWRTFPVLRSTCS